MKELVCICGERVVFLDPQVEAKTCPNCGMPVRQYELVHADVAPETKKKRKRTRQLSPRMLVFAGAVAVLLAVAGVLVSIAAARSSALRRAAAYARDAESAQALGDLNAAAADYRRAIRNYRTWGASPDIVKPIETALSAVERRILEAAALAANTAGEDELLSISLEEIARQAYASSPKPFAGVFDHDYARRVVILHGKVEEGVGAPFRASVLTVSYRVFSPTGDPVDLSFNGPFFERYRLKQGAECVVKAVLDKMYRDPAGQAGRWVIVLDAAKSSLVTDVAQLKGLGWKVDDEMITLVAAQRLLSLAY